MKFNQGHIGRYVKDRKRGLFPGCVIRICGNAFVLAYLDGSGVFDEEDGHLIWRKASDYRLATKEEVINDFRMVFRTIEPWR